MTVPRPIRVLSPLVANQIAAGEVVERPASVVKELLENALDAGATRVLLELEQGGVELVRVTDDGSGIPPAELPLAIASHATSKVESAADLEHIATLGFRGEALASIASVSRLSLRSRTAAEPGASQLDVEGDQTAAARPAAGAVGTSVTVRNLFFNTPARRKFLRTVATEQERCVDVARQIALSHPGIGFRVSCDGRVVMDLGPGQSPRERALGVLGKEMGPQLLDVHADQFDDSRGVALWGLAGLPAIARGSNKWQFVFVNGRPVRDRTIQHAISEAYRGLIDHTRYPTVVLMLEMSPAGVDVNVHPQKAEVRFRDSSMIHSVVLRALRDALRAADLTPTLGEIKPGFVRTDTLSLSRELPGSGLDQSTAAAGAPIDPAQSTARFVDYFRRFSPATPQPVLATQPQAAATGAAPSPAASQAAAPFAAPANGRAAAEFVPVPADRVLQVHKSFLVTQDEQGVVIIDQHALHERVMFEYLLHRVTAGGLETQRLLVPTIVQATALQIERLPDLAPLLARIGVEAEPMGPTSVGVHSFPSFLFDRGVDPVDFMESLLTRAEDAEFVREMKQGGEAAMRDVLDMMSCKAAVKAGDKLSEIELSELVKLRDDVERSSSCPHGRPTSIRLTIKELEKLFGRT
ncbi:DNA mismatch repair protein MutL [Phycisphaerales bacterium]|nr:DNA mismatch repair protein MutL [Phycisphaerales bacterium]